MAKKTERITMRNCPKFSKPKKMSPNQIRKFRKSISMSQAAFARLLGCSTNTVKAWEQGLREPLSCAFRLMEIIERKGVNGFVKMCC